MEDYPLCACGCGQRVKRKGSKYTSNHRNRKYNFIKLTSDILKDPLIHQQAIEHMKDCMIDAGYLSKNKNIKTNCKTMKPLRGKTRLFKDHYVETGFVSSYNKVDYYQVTSHRLAAMLYVGYIPENYLALHKCDVKMCCNPYHLYIGTMKDNKLDASNRRGNYSPNARLTRHCCESIRYYKNLGEHSVEEIAKYHNCCGATVTTLEDRDFTTDGSEVIGNIFIPQIIPESRRVTKVKLAINLGKKLCEIYDNLKKRFPSNVSPSVSEKFYQIGKDVYGLGRAAVFTYMRLYKTNIHRANYKYSRYKLYKMIADGVDVSVPI